jgi:hypothetical protein
MHIVNLISEDNMIRNGCAILVLAALMIGCREQAVNKSAWENVPVITVAGFDSLAGNFIGQEIQIEGLVDHICRHGGKRMFLVNENTQGRVKVTTGENIPSFDVALEGSTVAVKGIVEELRIDEQYLQEWEQELAQQETTQAFHEPEEEHPADSAAQEGESGHQEGTHSGMGEQADQGTHTETLDQIAAYRQQITESEKGYLSFFSIVCSEFKELPE